jgi:hypothetical protein
MTTIKKLILSQKDCQIKVNVKWKGKVGRSNKSNKRWIKAYIMSHKITLRYKISLMVVLQKDTNV